MRRPYTVSVLSILIVEDDEDLAGLLKELFEQLGWAVQWERNGTNALLAAEGARPDVIVTDGMMPTMGGIELLSRLRSHATLAQVPVILMSGADVLLRSARGAESKTATIRKPFDPDQLIALVKAVI